MKDLPRGWASASLGDLAVSIKNGIFVSRPGSDPDGVPILRISAIRPGSLTVSDVRYSARTVEELSIADALIRSGDLLFTRYSGNAEFVGACSIVPEGVGELTYPDKLIRVRMNRRLLLPKFAHFLMQAASVRSQIRALSRTTAGQVGISGGNLKSVGLPVPPLCEQRRIVAAIDYYSSRLDAARSNLAEVMDRVRALEQSILAAVADGSLVGADGEWADRSIGELAEVQGGIQKQPKRRPFVNKYPFLRVANVARGSLNLDEVHEIELFEGELERFRLRRGDLLVVEGNGSAEQIGRACIWGGQIRNAVHQNHLIRVRPNELLVPEYLELVWNSSLIKERLRRMASSTSGLFTLSTSKIKSVRLPVPPVDMQARLVQEANSTLARLGLARGGIGTAETRSMRLRSALLNEAFAGRLVAQDPSDEPASELLARIRAEREAAGPVKRAPRQRVGRAGDSSGRTRKELAAPPTRVTDDQYEQGELPL